MTIDEFFTIKFKNSVNFGQREQSGYHWNGGGNSEIGKERFRTVLIRKGVPLSIIDILFGKIDADNDGKISRTDFLKVMQQYAPQTQEQESVSAEQSSYAQEEQQTEPVHIPVSPLDELKKNLERKAVTYRRNGAPRYSAVGVAVNARW